jgi:hypothetical protein
MLVGRRSAATVGVALVLASPVAPIALVCSVLDSVSDRSLALVLPITLSMIMYMLITIITTLVALSDIQAITPITHSGGQPSEHGYSS